MLPEQALKTPNGQACILSEAVYPAFTMLLKDFIGRQFDRTSSPFPKTLDEDETLDDLHPFFEATRIS